MKTTNSQPILCGTGFSGNARQAANVAAALAQRFDAPLWLVHVTSEPLPADTPAAVESSSVREPMRSRLLTEGERLRSLGAVVEERMITGTPDVVLSGLAERFNADVVYVGSHTRPGFTAKLFGSVALGVLKRCRRPVLTVWPPRD